MADIVMMTIIGIAMTFAAGWAFKRADVAILTAMLVVQIYMCLFIWEQTRQTIRLMNILTGDIQDVHPELKATMQRLWHLLEDMSRRLYKKYEEGEGG